jgi:hypothetical protein
MLVVAVVVLDIIVVVRLVQMVEQVVEEEADSMMGFLENQVKQTQVVAVEAVVDQTLLQIIEAVQMVVVV